MCKRIIVLIAIWVICNLLYANFSNPIFLAVGAGATVGFIKTGLEEHIS